MGPPSLFPHVLPLSRNPSPTMTPWVLKPPLRSGSPIVSLLSSFLYTAPPPHRV